jgi:protein-disulfide isomerase
MSPMPQRLPLSDTGLIGTCLGVVAVGLIALTSGAGSAPTPTPAPQRAETVVQAPVAEVTAPVVAAEAPAESFGDQVRAYLLQNPEVIFEAVAEFERRNSVAQADMDRAILDANADQLHDDGFSWVGGNPDGDITLIKFSDYRCGFCKRAHAEVRDLLEADGNIRFVLKELPILGPESDLSARFAMAVLSEAGGAAYAAVHDALMAHDGAITPEFLSGLADEQGLSIADLLPIMQSEEVTENLAETRMLAQRLQISGTPTFIMESEILRGFLPAEAMAEVAASLRAE